ncbi:MAG: glycerol-3-phosphate acyltransferase [Hyphomicrobiaceae bacterium]|nr:glycerol-3-phosphate acyltransferase [Hyphomicrobiaceae bacterium]MCC0023804.1 glycerol-3-phosphate acyltransferase [Hyphomicrobiaceae bacterium]
MSDLTWPIVAILACVSYLWGSVSPARVIGARVLPGQRLDDTKVVLPNSGKAEIRYRGVSATSLGAKLGPKWGMLIGVLDMLKAVVPMLLVHLLWPGRELPLLVAAFVMLGHNWPLFHGFHGGRGQSVLIGALLFIDPLSVVICFPVGVAVGLLVLRDMFVAYTLGQYLLIAWFAFTGTPAELLFAITVNLIYSIAAWPEARDYLEARSKGHVGKIENFRDFFTAHPAMGEKRFDRDA